VTKGVFSDKPILTTSRVAALLRALAAEEAVCSADLGPDTLDSFRPDNARADRAWWSG
jgi:hypothetical protein